MNNRSSCNPAAPAQATDLRRTGILLSIGLCLLTAPRLAQAGDAPSWMRAVASAPLPAHDDKTDSVLLYSDQAVIVQSVDKIKTHVRMVYKILRPSGRDYGMAAVSFNPHRKISGLHGWCIPVQGKDYEVKDKEAVEVSLPKIAGSELISDVKEKLLQIPAPDPGSVVGYEYEEEEQPMVLQDVWMFQREIPAREQHYSLQLPPGWEYKASWINYSEIKPTPSGNNQWEWVINDVRAIRKEAEMPPIYGVAGQLVVSFFPAGGASANGFNSWQQMGSWYLNLTNGRRDASPQITQQVATLTAAAQTPLEKAK